MCLKKQFTKLTPRLIEEIQDWGKVKQKHNYWSKNDSKIYLLLEIMKKDMLKEIHENKKIIDEKIEQDFYQDITNED